AWVHAAEPAALERKRTDLMQTLGPWTSGVTFAGGELGDEHVLDGVDRAGIDTIVHTAAITRFNVEADLAERMNVIGAERVMRFAERCPRLERFALLSSIYA